jgi:hypothetical protein
MLLNVFTLAGLVLIALLLLILVEYEVERRKLKQEIRLMYEDMGFRISSHIERTFRHAKEVRYTLPHVLYKESPKKNTIVKEVCEAFYEALLAHIKSPR